MAMKWADIREWGDTLPDDAEVGIDEGGLVLTVAGDEAMYLEVGGLPGEMAGGDRCPVCQLDAALCVCDHAYEIDRDTRAAGS
jgi:hypothetical protein